MSATDEQAGPAAERLRRIEPLIDRELVELGLDDLLVELLNRARDVLDVDTAVVLLHESGSSDLVAAAASGLEEEVRQGVRIPLGQGFAGRVAASRQPVVLDDVSPSNVINPILTETGVRSLLGVPLVASGRLLGVLHVGTLTPRKFTCEDVELLQVVADRAALAAQAQLSDADRSAARALQRSLIPWRLPEVAGLGLAGRYVPSKLRGVSGDWYDVFHLPSGRLAIVIGDAMGHGLHASVVMGRLRSTLRAYAIENSDPADVLTRVDRKLQHFEPDELATILYGIFDRGFESITFSSAGHPMPVLASPGSDGRLVDLAVDPPIGTPSSEPRSSATVGLPAGSLLLCYTDGLVERRDSPLDRQLELLCAATKAGSDRAVCSTVLRTLLGDQAPDDDVAVLAAWRSQR